MVRSHTTEAVWYAPQDAPPPSQGRGVSSAARDEWNSTASGVAYLGPVLPKSLTTRTLQLF
jgi:hypothetical protein